MVIQMIKRCRAKGSVIFGGDSKGLHCGQESPYILSGLTSVGSYLITVLGAADRL